MGGEINITFGAAFAAGVLSFFSPCILPLLPVYVSQLSVAVSNRGRGGFSPGWGVFLQALIFVFGFTLVFVSLGTATSMIGSFLALNREILLKAGGVFVVLMGLNLSGFLRVNIFARQWSPLQGFQPRGILGSFFLGMAFALGWTPCVGPVLASILTLAATTGSAAAGSLLLAFYSLGLAVPFLFLCFTFDRVPGIRNILQKYSRLSLVVSGILLVILGMLMFFNKLQVLAAYLAF
ncbi:MAG: cytochrome c biogenesis CcdA family protein [Peptococcaceae bacterium]|nr:cytochrome c biogenesis CcdA family protein [Peptococcaceae bacterium]